MTPEQRYTKDVLVRSALSEQFRQLVQGVGAKVTNVTELSEVGLLFSIEGPMAQRELIADYGFQSFIDNPAFQKYYIFTPEVLRRIEEDRKAHEYRYPPKLAFLEPYYHQQIHAVSKAPIGVCTISPENIGRYNRETDCYEFSTVRGIANRGKWNASEMAWEYKQIDITPTIPKPLAQFLTHPHKYIP